MMEIKNYLKELDPYRVKLEKAELQKRRGAQSVESDSSSNDRVSLSSEGRLRTEAWQSAMNAPDMRESKIASVRNQIADGSYVINTKNIAQRLLAEEPEIFAI